MKQIFYYTIASMVSGVSGVIAIPLLIEILGIKHFGQWGLIEPVILLTSQLVLVGANFAVFEAMRSTGLSAGFISLTWLKCGATASILFLPVLILIFKIASWPLSTAFLISIATYAEAILILMQSATRASGHAANYLAGSLLRAFPWIIGLAALKIMHVGNILDVLLIRVVSASAAVIFFFKKMSGESDSQVDLVPSLKEMMRYGFPITLSAVLVPLGDVIERSILALVISFSATGTYFIAIKYAAVLNLGLMTPIGLWWPRERARLRNLPDGGKKEFERIQRIVPFLCILAATVFILLSDHLLPLLAPNQELPAKIVVTFLVYSALLRGVTPLLSPGAMEPGSTWMSGVSTGLSILLLLPACYVLGRGYGLSGFALANLLSAIIGGAALTYLSMKTYPIPRTLRSLSAIISIVAFIILLMKGFEI